MSWKPETIAGAVKGFERILERAASPEGSPLQAFDIGIASTGETISCLTILGEAGMIDELLERLGKELHDETDIVRVHEHGSAQTAKSGS